MRPGCGMRLHGREQCLFGLTHFGGRRLHEGPGVAVGVRVAREASAGEHIGQPSSREIVVIPVPTPFTYRKAEWTGALTRAPGQPGVV